MLQEHAERLLHLAGLAWPDGIPPEEIAIISGLGPDRVGLAAERLEMMLRYEREGGWQTAVAAGMSRANFFTLLRAWRKRRSLASIVPRVAPHASGSRYGTDLDAIIAEVVRADPEATRQTLTAAVEKRLQKGPAASTLAAKVNKAKTAFERQKYGGENGFGRLVVVDATPVAIGASKGSAKATAWAGFVHDVPTGLNVAVAASADARSATLVACSRAERRIRSLRDGGGGERARLEVHLRGSGWARLDRRETLVLRTGDDPPLIDVLLPTADRSEGSRIMNLIGHRYGPVTLKPRLRLSSDGDVGEVMPGYAIVDARIDAEASRRWDASVDAGLSSAVPKDDLSGSLRMLLRAERFVSPSDG